jgi:hypothetical protein
VEVKTLNIDLQLKIGFPFVFIGLNTLFWYYLVTIIFVSIDRPEERRFIFFAAFLWFSVKILQLFFLIAARRFKTRPIKKQFQLTQRLLLLYIFMFIAEISYSVNRGLGVFDWGANIFELFLLFNMMNIYNTFRSPDVAKVVISYERDMEIEKEKSRVVEQKQRVEGQFIVFDPSLHLESVKNPHEQLDPWVSKNKHLNYFGEVNPFDTMYEKDLENYRNQFKSAQASAHQKAIDGYKGAKGGIIGWIILVLLGSIFPLIGTINAFMDGNAGFWQYFHIALLSVLLLLPLIGYIILNKKGIDQSPKSVGKIKPIQRPIVQFYESESELIIVQAESDNLTENKFDKIDLIGLRSNNELVLQYFDGDLVERHQILKMDDETYEMLTPAINKLRDTFKSDFGREKSKFRGPSFKICGACKEPALGTDIYCDDCGTLLP